MKFYDIKFLMVLKNCFDLVFISEANIHVGNTMKKILCRSGCECLLLIDD